MNNNIKKLEKINLKTINNKNGLIKEQNQKAIKCIKQNKF